MTNIFSRMIKAAFGPAKPNQRQLALQSLAGMTDYELQRRGTNRAAQLNCITGSVGLL